MVFLVSGHVRFPSVSCMNLHKDRNFTRSLQPSGSLPPYVD
jgi:hypothetical protein